MCNIDTNPNVNIDQYPHAYSFLTILTTSLTILDFTWWCLLLYKKENRLTNNVDHLIGTRHLAIRPRNQDIGIWNLSLGTMQMTINKMSIDQMSISQVSIGQISICQMSICKYQLTRGQCYTTFFVRNLRIFVISQCVCPWQAFQPSLTNTP